MNIRNFNLDFQTTDSFPSYTCVCMWVGVCGCVCGCLCTYTSNKDNLYRFYNFSKYKMPMFINE